MDIIKTSNAGKNYYRSWLFRNVEESFEIDGGNSYAFLGNNGSGKSTFLLLLCGQVSPTEGDIEWKIQGKQIPENQRHLFYALSSPGMELPEELNLREWFAFISKVKPLQKHVDISFLAEICGFTRKTLEKPISYFSSGMKQRVKLCGNLLADVPISFVDEPLSNLDTDGIKLYHDLIESQKELKTLFVASNDPKEYEFVKKRFEISEKQIIQLK